MASLTGLYLTTLVRIAAEADGFVIEVAQRFRCFVQAPETGPLQTVRCRQIPLSHARTGQYGHYDRVQSE